MRGTEVPRVFTAEARVLKVLNVYPGAWCFGAQDTNQLQGHGETWAMCYDWEVARFGLNTIVHLSDPLIPKQY